jgi:regulator of replication initiation timing
MFDKLKDYALEKHIRNLLKQYYAQFGLTLREAERLPMKDLIQKLSEFLADNKSQNDYYASVVNNLEEKVAKLTIGNNEMQQRFIEARAENKSLHGELAKVRENNYNLKLENTIIKQRFGGNEKDKSKDNDLSIAR